MPVFISYAHEDSAFVDRLASRLIEHNISIWLDRWELRVGDSLIRKIEDAITGASAVIVVLSRSSVNSEWCRNELSAAQLRELEERCVLVLPVLIEDCDLPLFVRGKYYADFRSGFDSAFAELAKALAAYTSASLGRTSADGSFIDWNFTWALTGTAASAEIWSVSYNESLLSSIVATYSIQGNDIAAKRLTGFASALGEAAAKHLILESAIEALSCEDPRIALRSDEAQRFGRGVRDSNLGVEYMTEITCVRLGNDNGNSLLFDYRSPLEAIRDTLQSRFRPNQPTG